jgi:hypothetical protein
MEQPEHDGKSTNGYGYGNVEKQIVIVHLYPTPGRLTMGVRRSVAPPDAVTGKNILLDF